MKAFFTKIKSFDYKGFVNETVKNFPDEHYIKIKDEIFSEVQRQLININGLSIKSGLAAEVPDDNEIKRKVEAIVAKRFHLPIEKDRLLKVIKVEDYQKCKEGISLEMQKEMYRVSKLNEIKEIDQILSKREEIVDSLLKSMVVEGFLKFHLEKFFMLDVISIIDDQNKLRSFSEENFKKYVKEKVEEVLNAASYLMKIKGEKKEIKLSEKKEIELYKREEEKIKDLLSINYQKYLKERKKIYNYIDGTLFFIDIFKENLDYQFPLLNEYIGDIKVYEKGCYNLDLL